MAQTPKVLIHGVVLVVSAGSGASHTQHYTIPKASEIAVSFFGKKKSRVESNITEKLKSKRFTRASASTGRLFREGSHH